MPFLLKICSKFLSEQKIVPPAVVFILLTVHPTFNRAAIADSTTFSLSAIESSGHYGLDTTTKMHATVFKMSHRNQTGSFSLTIPYLDINGSASILYEDIDTGELFLIDENDHRAGLGDLILKFDLNAWENIIKDKKIYIGGSIKLPTGNKESRLGSGATDWTLFISARALMKNNILTGQLGYQISGNTEFTDRKNRLFVSSNLYHITNKFWGAGFSMRFKQRIQDFYDDQKSIGLFINHKINKAWNTNLSLNRGFSESVSRYSLGLEISYQLR